MPCTFAYENHTHRALVTDFSAGGLFLETETRIALGSELALRIDDPRYGEVEVRGRVVRRRVTPVVIANWVRRGVGIQILKAPERYRDVLRAAEPAPESAWTALEPLDPPFEPPAADDAPAPAAALDGAAATAEPEPPPEAAEPAGSEAAEGGAPELGAGALAPSGTPHTLAPDDAGAPARVEDGLPAPAAPPVAGPAARAEAPSSAFRADALLVHDGELDDVRELLAAMGADAHRQTAFELRGFAGWERPPRLVVASGRSALRVSLGHDLEGQGSVAIAVVESESQTLCGMLRRQGYRYVVRRPVHPEALRLLLGRALFRGRERRAAARVSVGCEVGLRYGLRWKPATLLELSRSGCRLLIPEWVAPGTRLSLRVPSLVTGNRPLVLAGRVLRCERERRSGALRAAAALRFDRLDPSARMRLEALIAAHTLGPAPLPRGPGGTPASPARRDAPAPAPAPRASASPANGGPAPAPAGAPGDDPPALASAEAPREAGVPAPPPAAAGASDGERRRSPRVPHRAEVLSLEPTLARVRHTLLGIDLSTGGVRVEPHPDLALGDRVCLAIYDAASGEALVLEAEAVRDEGARGVLLHFRDVAAEACERIERIVGAAPQIECADAGEGRGVVVAEMLAQQPA